MKTCFLALFLSLFAGTLLAQPSNDDCITARNIGTLPVPTACPGGIGQPIVITGSNVGATAANPYPYLSNCNPSDGGTSMSVPANDVWYQFTATGYRLTAEINATFGSPNIAFWQGTCDDLSGRGCATGAGGFTSLTVDQMVPGNIYYIQVSGFDVEEGDFTLTIHNDINCDNCMLLSSLTVSPPPVNGMYQPGQEVSFCYHIDQYAEVNTNWLHGVQIDFGPGWNQASVVPLPAASYDGSGTWDWYSDIVDTDGVTWEAGFYYDRFEEPLGGGFAFDGDPGNNFGDHIPVNVNADQDPYPIPANIWNFCWSVSVTDVCVPGANLGITINTSGDGESGSWTNNGCNGDPVYVFQAVTSCCPPNLVTVPAGCDTADGSATATPVGDISPYVFEWYDASHTLLASDNNATGAQTLDNLPGGTYSVHITDANNCLQVLDFTIGGSNVSAPVLNSNSPLCEGENLLLQANSIPGAQYFWTGPDGFGSNVQNPTLNNAQVTQQGIYSCYVEANGCTGPAATVNVLISPAPVADFVPGHPVCEGEPFSISPGAGNFPPGTVIEWDFSGGIANGSGIGPYTVVWHTPGDHPVTLTLSYQGCSDSQTHIASIGAIPGAGFLVTPPTVTVDNPHVEITDQSTGSTNWHYAISDGGSSTLPGFGHDFPGEGVYYITQTVSNEFGCVDQAVQSVQVKPVSTIYIPNAFTPGNNQDANEFWEVIGNNLTNFKVMVFNRWGEVVFSSEDQHMGWNGYRKNKGNTPVKQDVYVYKVWYTDAQGNDQTQTGHVTIVR